MNEDENEPEKGELKRPLSGLAQKILGEIETVGGVLTGDPNTQAEGEFNVEVGTIREDLEDQEIEEASK